MLDEIYLRLLFGLIPSSVKISQLDTQRLLSQFNEGSRGKSSYAELIKSIYDDNPNSNIGLLFGQHLHPSALCDLSRSLVTADNFKQAINLIELYHTTHNVSYYLSIHNNNGTLSIALTYPYKSHTSEYHKRFCAEAAFSYVVNGLRESVAAYGEPIEIHFDFAKPAYADEYKHWGCPVHFNQPLAMIIFDSKVLLQNLLTSNHVLHPIYLNKDLDNWRQLKNQYGLEYRAIYLMMQHHPHAFSSTNLAKLLSISVRGLQKRLNKQCVSFSHLSNLAKRELSKVYLFQKQWDIELTAEQLGFQSSSGFRRFFKQEFEQTPAEYQKRFSPEPENIT